MNENNQNQGGQQKKRRPVDSILASLLFFGLPPSYQREVY